MRTRSEPVWALLNRQGERAALDGLLEDLREGRGRVPAGLWARTIQRLLALNACIWHNWMIGAPIKRSLIAYDHV